MKAILRRLNGTQMETVLYIAGLVSDPCNHLSMDKHRRKEELLESFLVQFVTTVSSARWKYFPGEFQ